MPAISATDRLSNRAITAAASGNSSNEGSMSAPATWPTTGTRRKADAADSTAASTQTRVAIRWTGMPSSRARSAFSALARTARPVRVSRKNKLSAPATNAVTTTIAT